MSLEFLSPYEVEDLDQRAQLQILVALLKYLDVTIIEHREQGHRPHYEVQKND